MLTVSGALQKRFAEHLAQKGIPVGQHGVYQKWVRYFLDFCKKYQFTEEIGKKRHQEGGAESPGFLK